jgi:hypothetical protein
MAYNKYNVSAADFVRAWESSTDAAEVAAKLGMPRPLVNARAADYRRMGVKLKKLKRSNSRRLDVEALNKLTQPHPAAQPNDGLSC